MHGFVFFFQNGYVCFCNSDAPLIRICSVLWQFIYFAVTVFRNVCIYSFQLVVGFCSCNDHDEAFVVFVVV